MATKSEMTVRCIWAPGIGIVLGTRDAKPVFLSDRIANKEAFPGEKIIRVPVSVFAKATQS